MLEDPVAAPKAFLRRHVKYTRPRVRFLICNYRPRRRSYETRRRFSNFSLLTRNQNSETRFLPATYLDGGKCLPCVYFKGNQVSADVAMVSSLFPLT